MAEKVPKSLQAFDILDLHNEIQRKTTCKVYTLTMHTYRHSGAELTTT